MYKRKMAYLASFLRLNLVNKIDLWRWVNEPFIPQSPKDPHYKALCFENLPTLVASRLSVHALFPFVRNFGTRVLITTNSENYPRQLSIFMIAYRPQAPNLMPTKHYYQHINALRGLAILLVFLYHLQESWCPNGYLGVDVFFVISGFFFMPSLLDNNGYDKWWRALVDYYRKKFLRIVFPVAIMVLLTLLAALFLLAPSSLKSAAETAVSVMLGYSNISFGRLSVDYFASDVKENLFLHTWYISVLLQIMLVVPVIFLPFAKRGKKLTCSIMAIISIISALVFFQRWLPYGWQAMMPDFLRDEGTLGSVYYSTFGRVWEITAGALIGILPSCDHKRVRTGIFAIALVLIIVLSFRHNHETGLPILTVFAAALIIKYGEDTYISHWVANKLLMWLGAISFSLYLVHWPAMALWRSVAIRDILSWEYIAVVLISLLLSYAFYKIIEKRKASLLFAFSIWSFVILFCLCVQKWGAMLLFPNDFEVRTYSSVDYKDWQPEQDPTLVVSFPSSLPIKAWHYGHKTSDPKKPSTPVLHIGDTSKKANFALIGDSYANALFPGMDIVGKKLGWSGIYLNPYITTFHNKLRCEYGDQYAFPEQKYEDLMRYFMNNESIQYIFVIHPWSSLFNVNTSWDRKVLRGKEAWEVSKLGFRAFCERLKTMGKTVVVIKPLPELHIKSGSKLHQMIAQKRTRGEDPYEGWEHICMTAAQYQNVNGKICQFFDELENEGVCLTLDPVPVLMPNGIYNPIAPDHRLITYDHGHLSDYGAQILVEGLAKQISEILSGKKSPNSN